MISKTIDLAGETLHFADFGGGGPTIVLVHGLGGAHANWLAVGPALALHGRVVALDLPGFGRSARNPKGTSLDAMGDALARFIDAISAEPVHLVGNSMGGTLALLEGHARPERISSTLLVCPALPAPRGVRQDPQWMKGLLIASLPWGHVLMRRRAKRIGAEQGVRELLSLCCVDASRVPRDVLDASIALAAERASMPWNELAFSEATRSLVKQLTFAKRVREAIRQPGAPTLIVHGQRDRLVDVRSSRAAVAANPSLELIELPDLGHTPQLEDPDAFMQVASRWLDRAVSKPARTPVDSHAGPSRAADGERSAEA